MVAHSAEALELLKELACIPAPSGHEEQRAEFCLRWLEKQGFVENGKLTAKAGDGSCLLF